MDTITATELRTKVPDLVAMLLSGKSFDFVHRSQIIGTIIPVIPQKKTISSRALQKKIDALGLPSLTAKEIDRRYRAAMMKKHGQGLS